MADEIKLYAVGDIQPNRERPETLFELVKPTFAEADLLYCQLECTISDKGTLRTDVRNPAHRVPPHNIRALTSAGFKVVSYAGNNQLDYGEEAFLDTLNKLRENGIEVVGAGANQDEARAPVYVECKGTRIAFVNFCSILRDGFAATRTRSGISPLKVNTFYQPLENIYEQPGTPAKTITVPDHDDLEVVLSTIRTAKENADLVIGCFHWGVHFTYDLALYQPEVAYAAIDAGADLILGTHPHNLQSIDTYKGKPIFYSLGNFAFEQPEAVAQEGVKEYLSFYGIPREPDLKVHPHPRHCRNTMILKMVIRDKKLAEVRIAPAYFNDNAQPELLEAGTERYCQVVELIERLSLEVGTRLTQDNGELVVPLGLPSKVDTRKLIRERKISYPSLAKLASSAN
jgi:poly-gamma-glutamate capsule biosynthesis protein CapA/YwtB (metallophosphatase superfamily)